MTKLLFVAPDGNEIAVEAEDGQSVMQAAVAALVPGIEASCGGNCVCATCHCYFDIAIAGQLNAPSDTETEMLQCVHDPQPSSRLSCQIPVTAILEGSTIRVAKSQH
ncbi:MAG: 2Fe-2S iron-sulfur cluster-binding protein [Pirellulaceae bacterium]